MVSHFGVKKMFGGENKNKMWMCLRLLVSSSAQDACISNSSSKESGSEAVASNKAGSCCKEREQGALYVRRQGGRHMLNQFVG